MWGPGTRGSPYLGQQLREVLPEDAKGGPAEGQVAAPGLWLHGAARSLDRILGAQGAQLSPPAHPGELGEGQGTQGWVTGEVVDSEPGASLTVAPFMAAEDSTGRNWREAGCPRSGWVAWMMTRCSWGPTMPQFRATVTAVCRLSPGRSREGQSLMLSRAILTLTLICQQVRRLWTCLLPSRAGHWGGPGETGLGSGSSDTGCFLARGTACLRVCV